MAVDLTIRQNDTSPAFTAQVTDQNGNPLNLTGATVTFVMRALSSSTVTTNAAMSITNPTAGEVLYNWSTSDTLTAGLYMVELHVLNSDSSTYTYPNTGYMSVEVEESLLAASQQIVSVVDVKDVLNFQADDDVHDTKILRWINSVTPVIENLAGPIIPRTFVEWHDGGQTFVILRRRPSTSLGTSPLLELQAVSEYNGPIEWPLSIITSPDYGQLYSCQLDVNKGQVVRRTAGGGVQPFPYQPQAVHIWYTAGQSTVPANVYEATLELLRQNYQKTAQSTQGWSRGGGAEEVPGPPMGFFVPNRVREMLSPNRRFPSLA